jgi:hypothetical protein
MQLHWRACPQLPEDSSAASNLSNNRNPSVEEPRAARARKRVSASNSVNAIVASSSTNLVRSSWGLPLLEAVKLLGDDLTVPGKDRVRLDDGGHLRHVVVPLEA